jgi:hypothetical protein
VRAVGGCWLTHFDLVMKISDWVCWSPLFVIILESELVCVGCFGGDVNVVPIVVSGEVLWPLIVCWSPRVSCVEVFLFVWVWYWWREAGKVREEIQFDVIFYR